MSEAVVTSGANSHTAVAPSAERIDRFTRTERAVHWLQATSFLVLLLSGFALSIEQVAALIGHRAVMREIHLSAAFFFFFGPAIVALSANRPSVGEDVRAVDVWTPEDFRWLAPGLLLRLLGIAKPPQGRFNAGQKLNAIFVAGSTVLFTASGFLMWQNRRFPLDLVAQANMLHTVLAYLALVAFLGHLFLATLYPKTRHSLQGMTRGWVDRGWATEHHALWVQQQQTGASASEAPLWEAPRTLLQIALASFVALLASRLLFLGIGANPTDKVTTWLYAVTAWPGTGVVHPQTGVRLFDVAALAYLGVCLAFWLLLDRLRHLRQGAPETGKTARIQGS